MLYCQMIVSFGVCIHMKTFYKTVSIGIYSSHFITSLFFQVFVKIGCLLATWYHADGTVSLREKHQHTCAASRTKETVRCL